MKKLIFGVALLTSLASAQVAINDTLYVNGGTWTGTISVCWPAFTTASGAVLAKSCRDTTVTSGVVAVSLFPTEGASPAVSYSAHYRTTSGPNRGVTWDETWAVASSPSIQILHDVRRSSSTQVFPSEIVATGLPTGTYCWSVVNATVTGLVACSGGGGGSNAGDVVGPGSSTDNAVARFDGTTGKLIQNSVLIVDDSGNTQTPGSVTAASVASNFASMASHVGTIQSVVFTGSGLNDMTARIDDWFFNNCLIGSNDTLTVEIDGTGTPDTYKLTACGVLQETGVAIPDTDFNSLLEGISVQFGATSGHTIGDRWLITALDTPSAFKTQQISAFGSSIVTQGGWTISAFQEVARTTPLPGSKIFGVGYTANTNSPSSLVGLDVLPNVTFGVTAPGSIGPRFADQTAGAGRNCNLIVGSASTGSFRANENTTDCPSGRQMEIYGATDKPSQLLVENKSCTAATLATLIPLASQQCYCTDCQVTSGVDNTCTGTGSGAMAFRIGGDAKCLQ